jgi:hypothetical protein
MKTLLLTAALLAQQPDREAERELEARVRALRKAHEQRPTSQAIRDAIERMKEARLGRLFGLLQSGHLDEETKTSICQSILRDYPDTPLGRLLRVGPRP